MYVDFKITTWERITFDESLKDEVLAKLKSGEFTTGNDVYTFVDDLQKDIEAKVLPEVEEYMTPQENGDGSTIEFYEGDEIIYQNGES